MGLFPNKLMSGEYIKEPSRFSRKNRIHQCKVPYFWFIPKSAGTEWMCRQCGNVWVYDDSGDTIVPANYWNNKTYREFLNNWDWEANDYRLPTSQEELGGYGPLMSWGFGWVLLLLGLFYAGLVWATLRG